jgi:hypothetical protein
VESQCSRCRACSLTKYALNNWLRVNGPLFDTSTALEILGFTGAEAREGLAAHLEKSINPLAPPFLAIAEVKGMSGIALNVALLSPHRAMPNIILDSQERADVIAYILSLKTD